MHTQTNKHTHTFLEVFKIYKSIYIFFVNCENDYLTSSGQKNEVFDDMKEQIKQITSRTNQLKEGDISTSKINVYETDGQSDSQPEYSTCLRGRIFSYQL